MDKLCVSIILIIFLSIGCATIQPLNTASGKPEVTIQNVSKKSLSDVLVNAMLSAGCLVKSTTDYSIVFSKPINNLGASLLFGSRYDVTPEDRVIMNLIEYGNGIRIVITEQAITNPGSAFERVNDLTINTAQGWQQFLNKLAEELAIYSQGRVGIGCDDSGVITIIQEGSPAELSGLKVGDVLKSIDGKPFTNFQEAALLLRGEPETTVNLIVLRKSDELPFTITRKIVPLK